jgi:hypothetical protein
MPARCDSVDRLRGLRLKITRRPAIMPATAAASPAPRHEETEGDVE